MPRLPTAMHTAYQRLLSGPDEAGTAMVRSDEARPARGECAAHRAAFATAARDDTRRDCAGVRAMRAARTLPIACVMAISTPTNVKSVRCGVMDPRNFEYPLIERATVLRLALASFSKEAVFPVVCDSENQTVSLRPCIAEVYERVLPGGTTWKLRPRSWRRGIQLFLRSGTA